jgi:hypothetical protein
MSAEWTAADYRRDVAEQTEEWNAMWRDEARAASWDQLPPDDGRPTRAELEDRPDPTDPWADLPPVPAAVLARLRTPIPADPPF